MPARLLSLILLCLAWPPAPGAYPFGVLSAKAVAEPAQIPPGGKAEVAVTVSDGFQRPIPLASIRISAASGYFEASNQGTALGHTDKDGVFRVVWHSNPQTGSGPQVFEVAASKNGYVGQYPVSARAVVDVGEPPQ